MPVPKYPPVQPVLLGDLAQGRQDGALDFGPLHGRLERREVCGGDPLVQHLPDERSGALRVQHAVRNETVAGRVTVHQQAGKDGLERVHALKLFERDVFAEGSVRPLSKGTLEYSCKYTYP